MINLIAMHIQRFFSYLSAFTFGMLVLITGGNFLVMFVGWEAIGVVSYLLINFYFTRIQANKAAILAFTMNRQGDMLMSIGFFAIFALFGTLNYSSVFSLTPYMNETAITIIALLLFGGACAKSAQIPLHSWLPGSMEAPTPVSALLHAATLVKKLPLNSVNYFIINSLYAGKASYQRVYIYRYLNGIREIYKKISMFKIFIACHLLINWESSTIFNKTIKFLSLEEVDQQVTLFYLNLVEFTILNRINLLPEISNALDMVEGYEDSITSLIMKEEVLESAPKQKVKLSSDYISISKETSETTRELTFDFSVYKKKICEHKSKIDTNFLEWFIGFTEGDGSFIVKKRIIKKTGKVRLSLSFDVTQTISDVQVLYKIKEGLGFGKILFRKETERNVASFYVTGKENFLRLISIFNGNICSNYRYNQFKIWVEAYNEIYKENEVFIERKIKPSLNNAWLSGFIDAEGSFQGYIKSSKTSKLKYYPNMAFQVSQKNNDILYEIRLLFTNKDIGLNYDKSWNGWRLCFYSINLLVLVKSYVNKYELKTRKQISFLKWSNVIDLILTNKHLESSGLDQISKILSNLNKHEKDIES